MKDWKAASRNWLRNEKKFARKTFGGPENVVPIDPRKTEKKNQQRLELEEMLNGFSK